MGYYNFKKKLEGKDQSIDKMIAKLDKIEKLISSELSSKIKILAFTSPSPAPGGTGFELRLLLMNKVNKNTKINL